jgi:hypothetical protein
MKTSHAAPRPKPSASGFPTEFRQFGKWGPAYKPCKMVKPGIVKVRVLETGEEINYPLEHLLQDPKAA